MSKKLEIPEEITKICYVLIKTDEYDFGKISIWDTDISTACAEYTYLTEQEVVFKIPKQSEEDIKLKIVDSLKKEKEELASDYFMKVKRIDEKINQLLALEYNPVDSEFDEVVF